jgi:hypothetical protein
MDTINDPAWFYSSLAQTAAAIVGLIGAVLGSRIIDHIGLLRSERRVIDEAIKTLCAAVRSRVPTNENLRSWVLKQIEEDDQVQSQGRSHRAIYGEQFVGGGGWSGGAGEQVEVATHKARMDRKMKLIEGIKPLYCPLSGPVEEEALQSFAERLLTHEKAIARDDRDGEGAANQLRGDAETIMTLRREIARFRGKLLPSSFKFVFLVLIWLSATGVVWPLLALPGLSVAHPKTIMLTSFVLGMVGLISFFAYQFVELWRLGRFRWE